MPDVQVRPGEEDDLQALTDLYNHYVRQTPITFDTVPFTPEQRRPWLDSHPKDGPHRLLVAQEECPKGRILGYATSSPFRPKAAYDTSVEVSVYCAPDAGRRGIGTRLYTALFKALEGEDLHRAYAGLTAPNEASARLHARFGFRLVGTYREVGRKFGRYWDVDWYEKPLGVTEPRPTSVKSRQTISPSRR
ncbi:GNAT family N-acetyltransferase [Streptomyces sp. KR80]|uniref:GNAT family N-acetyltransferase n=1 Tax=Streptomyces sp. KR80 TaxID=3457426 RepID=UPI003FCF390F